MKTTVSFVLDSGAVRVIAFGEADVYLDSVDGYKVRALLPIDDDAILVLERDKSWGSFQNLVKIDRHGQVIWRAPLNQSMSPPNDYVSVVRGEGETLVAHTWGGMRVVIDLNTGLPLSEKFVK